MSTTSEAYLDIITGVERAWPVSYDACIMRDCPNCGVAAMESCNNPITGRVRKAPCFQRMARPLN